MCVRVNFVLYNVSMIVLCIQRSVVEVEWPKTGRKNLYRAGHRGKVHCPGVVLFYMLVWVLIPLRACQGSPKHTVSYSHFPKMCWS